MLSHILRYSSRTLLAVLLISMMGSCNKIPELEEIQPITPGGESIAEIIDADANFSVLKAGLTRAGLINTLGNKNGKFTLFAPDNAAFALGGIDETVINALPLQQLIPLLSYHIVPQAFPSASLPTTAPNIQLPTLLQPTDNPLFKLSTFPAKNALGAFVNNIPLKAVDLTAANGVIHTTFAPVMPPSATMRGVIDADPELTYFNAAIKRASAGQEGLTLDSLMNYPFPNLTIFAPTNAACIALLTALSLPADPSTFELLPVQTVQGLVAYHILGTNRVPVQRLFTVNLLTMDYETMIGPAPFPPVTVNADNPLAPTIKGAVNPTASNIVAANSHAVNGVLHKIDQVMLPQPF